MKLPFQPLLFKCAHDNSLPSPSPAQMLKK